MVDTRLFNSGTVTAAQAMPGVLQHFDLPDLLPLFAGRELRVESPLPVPPAPSSYPCAPDRGGVAVETAPPAGAGVREEASGDGGAGDDRGPGGGRRAAGGGPGACPGQHGAVPRPAGRRAQSGRWAALVLRRWRLRARAAARAGRVRPGAGHRVLPPAPDRGRPAPRHGGGHLPPRALDRPPRRRLARRQHPHPLRRERAAPDERLRLDPRVEDLSVAVVSVLQRRELAYASNRFPIGFAGHLSGAALAVDVGEENRHNQHALGDRLRPRHAARPAGRGASRSAGACWWTTTTRTTRPWSTPATPPTTRAASPSGATTGREWRRPSPRVLGSWTPSTSSTRTGWTRVGRLVRPAQLRLRPPRQHRLGLVRLLEQPGLRRHRRRRRAAAAGPRRPRPPRRRRPPSTPGPSARCPTARPAPPAPASCPPSRIPPGSTACGPGAPSSPTAPRCGSRSPAGPPAPSWTWAPPAICR